MAAGGDSSAQLGGKHAPGWEMKLPHLFCQHLNLDPLLTFASLCLSKLAVFSLIGSNRCTDTFKAVLILVWLWGEGTEGAGGVGTLEHILELREGGACK